MRLQALKGLLRRGVQPGLQRVSRILAGLGYPERAFRSVVVGGSNGKGSTARALAAILKTAGVKTGLYTSPHLLWFGERIMVDGQEAEEGELEDLLGWIWPHIEAAGASYFEAVTVLALVYFARRGVEMAVLEVGLGGRFDAVNAVEPEISLITNLSLEHTDWLGSTLAHIAREKAGIMRSGRPVLSAAVGWAAELLAVEARRRGALLDFVRPRMVEPAVYGVDFSLAARRYHGSLMGRFQAANLALAARAALFLGIGEKHIEKGLRAVRNPGRLSYYPVERLICDGAHNPAGARALAQALADYFPASRKTLIFAVSADKDAAAMATTLRPHFDQTLLTAYPGERSRDPSELVHLFPNAEVESDPMAALARAQARRPPGGLVVVAGSLYLLAALARQRAGLPAEERSQ